MRWHSCAEWGPEVEGLSSSDNVSKDTHTTADQAYAVCKLLNKHGFGGQGKYFPVRTWVERADEEAGDKP